MKNKFINNSPTKSFNTDEDVEQCGAGDLDLNDLENLQELERERVKIKGVREKRKESRSVPYVTYEEEELIYIPIVFILYEDSALGEVYHHGKEYYVEVLEHLNTMLAGTYVIDRPSYYEEGDSLGPAIEHPDHGVECRIRYKLPTKLPVDYLKKFNYAAKTPSYKALNFETVDDVFDALGRPIGHSRFRYDSSSVLNDLSSEANSAYEVAEEAYIAYTETLTGDEASNLEASQNSPEYEEFVRTGHIKDMGGLIDCGEDGAIFIRDNATLKGDTLSAFSYARGWGRAEPYASMYEYRVKEPGVSTGSARDHVFPMQDHNARGSESPRKMSVNFSAKHLHMLTIPAIHIINLRGEDSFIGDVAAGYAGVAGFPTESTSGAGELYPHGVIKMNMGAGAPPPPSEYAQVLLHELGHASTLTHTFSGGYLFNNYSPERIGDITLPFTGDAEPLNVLSPNDKLYIEGSLKYARDLREGIAQTPHEFETYTEEGNIIRKLPSLDDMSIYTHITDSEGLYSYSDLKLRRAVYEAAMFSGVTWGGSLSDHLLTPEGNPQLVINKTTYTTHTEGITGEVSTPLTGFANPDTSSGGYGYTPSNFNGPTFNVPAGVLTSCVISLHAPETTSITVRDQNGVIFGHHTLWFGDTYTIDIPSEALVGVTSIQLTVGFSMTFFIDSIIFNTSEATIYTSTPAIDFVTKIPYCKLDEEGNQTDVYDDFWAINGNWLKDGFPEYPPNTSTNDMHNIEYCPCLHAAQFYLLPAGEMSSIIPLVSPIALHDIYKDTANQYIDGEMSFAIVEYVLGALYTGLDYLSIDAKQGLTIESNNGYVPIFAFCGIHMQLRKHSLLGGIETLFDEDGDYLQDNPTSDRVTDTVPQNRGFATWDLKYPERQRFMSGSSDADSPYYNPYRLVGDLEDFHDTFSGDLLPSEYTLYDGLEVYGNPLTYTSMYECMQYHSTFGVILSETIPETVADYESHFTMLGESRVSYSPDQIAIVEACVSVGSGIFGKARLFGDLVGLSTAEASEDMFTPIYEALVEEVESEGSYSYVGCSNPAAVNYNPEATIKSERPCIFPGENCVLPTVELRMCAESVLNCGEVLSNELYLEYFEEGATESAILSSTDYPVYEGCDGGGFKYVLDSSVCVFGTISSEGCLVGGGASQEDVNEEIISSGVEYVLNCEEQPLGNRLKKGNIIFPYLYTLGGVYFTSKGERYSGPYVYRSGGIVWAGEIHNTVFRIYTKEQLRRAKISTPDVTMEIIKFFKIKENIENICKFVKL